MKKLLKLDPGNTELLAQKHQFSSSFSDFITRYTAVSSTNMRTETAEYYSVDPDDGLTMNLGVNPLLQFGLDETRAQYLWQGGTCLREDSLPPTHLPSPQAI